MTSSSVLLLLFPLLLTFPPVAALHVVITGGTGPLGQAVSHVLSNPPQSHKITVLTRNSFLASTPSRVSSDFGWIGKSFLSSHPNVFLRDWDGGDLLDIVGKDWIGWQEDTLSNADVVINLVGGLTVQRSMATERIIRGLSEVGNPRTMVVSVSPTDEDLRTKLRKDRVALCEKMVQANCPNGVCLRFGEEKKEFQRACEEIVRLVDSL
uniref:NAD-dependent epimerase/dehydratase domain-containing protein n=1 Tax=Corethron hystrix TaxID=216773 RepID=A0A7S1BHI4_9STRA|mmetsp:Transcript_25500/g.58830  ORF Transcript_25500/g.58830 Transcript_25500/m.58830 type:complete len:209 (+) Transcript_25500:12-638(+)|eukprot:CAMPEP_0113300028 /NCGR_PEP_ID=MMETSP0010_2-20120614/1826_1 /TAXON_ID=216773 ORGANISM="Corethron hystrix, Strain 308" /NCGR_SAMPLE_ID=MMETSP0010_2 /ASSEMBLY_ACC=CAM_ASM_000155 /LENGTH=208 /DNA_ID=CAMNT_0000153379 /DNA_START=12 /DNA_END=638 /DNA_ORIENTATION=- /assembly_acc=CAM_ASM_000155